MALDVSSNGLPSNVVFVRGAQTPAGEGAIDGWREDLARLSPNGKVLAPGDSYVPHFGHKETAVAVAKVLAEADEAVLLMCHSYGGNIAYQVLRAVPQLSEKVSGIVHMASPLKMQIGILPEPSPDLAVPVIGFKGNYDATVPVVMTGSSIDTKMYAVDCGHNDFVGSQEIRQLVLSLVQAELVKAL